MTQAHTGDIPVIRLKTGIGTGTILNEIIPAIIPDCSSWSTKTEFRFEIYCPDPDLWAERNVAVSNLLEEMGELLPDEVHVEQDLIKREDWAEVWKQYFHPLKVSDRISIRPSWENLPFPPTESVIVIDPGMSFGTGRHGTTLACLRYIDTMASELSNASFLDIGCGSGILTIAAAQLGFRSVELFDFDPDAVQCSKENLELNGITAAVPFVCDIAEFHCEQPHDVVVANLESPILKPNVEQICSCVIRPNGHLVLSGILDREFTEVAALFEQRGFVLKNSTHIDEWRTGYFVVE